MSSPKLEAILCEVGEVRKAIEATRGAIYTTFGVVLPGLIAVFLLTADKVDIALVGKNDLAAVFIVLASMGILWTQNLWMEVLRYVRYYYLALMPRLYRESQQSAELNFLTWSGKRSLRSQLPILLFDFGTLLILAGVYRVFVYPAKGFLADAICLAFILAAMGSVACVMAELQMLERDVSRSAAEQRRSDSRTSVKSEE